jgi:hypothetical protein
VAAQLASNPAGKIGANDKDQMEPIRRILDASFVFEGMLRPARRCWLASISPTHIEF